MRIGGKNITYRNVRNKITFGMASIKNQCFGRSVRFIKTDELIQWSREWSARLSSYDLIIGIPRSGLIPAIVIAGELGIPFSTPGLYNLGMVYHADDKILDMVIHAIWQGIEESKIEWLVFGNATEDKDFAGMHILLIDDTINTGESLGKASSQLSSELMVDVGAVVASKEYIENGQLYYKTLTRDRIFEWNLSGLDMKKVASDMDGVLCENAPLNGYESWIVDPEPNFLPKSLIGWIITARQEKDRKITEAWLDRNGVTYGVLLMDMDLDRRIEFIRSMRPRPDLILESDSGHAKRIWNCTGIPTLCFDTMEIAQLKKEAMEAPK